MDRSTRMLLPVVALCLCLSVANGVGADEPGPANRPLPPQDGQSTGQPTPPFSASWNELAMKHALMEPASLDFQNTSLLNVLQYIAQKYHLHFLFDNAALKDTGVDPTTTMVTFAIKDVTLHSALDLLLAQYDLAAIVKNEVLFVTSKAKADSMLETRLYDVRDLVIQDYDPSAPPEFDSLMDAIRSTVNPPSWDKAGGQGSVAPFNSNGVCALMVWQNQQGQEQVEKMLQELRTLRPRQALNQ
jgi:hypothetical protein